MLQTSAAAAEAVLCQWAASGYPWFRLHPKGRGVVVARQEGVPAFTFVEEYFGQLHTGKASRGFRAWVAAGEIEVPKQ